MPLSHLFLQPPHKVGTIIIFLLKIRLMSKTTQGQTCDKGGGQGLDPGSVQSPSPLLFHHCLMPSGIQKNTSSIRQSTEQATGTCPQCPEPNGPGGPVEGWRGHAPLRGTLSLALAGGCHVGRQASTTKVLKF